MILNDRLKEFVCDSNEALRFRLLKSTDDPDQVTADDDLERDFGPEMTHQIYGEKSVAKQIHKYYIVPCVKCSFPHFALQREPFRLVNPPHPRPDDFRLPPVPHLAGQGGTDPGEAGQAGGGTGAG